MTPVSKTTESRASQRQFTGEVVGVSEAKTIRVSVRSTKTHPKYRKQYTRTKKYAVHDETKEAKIGDVVLFEECRPISKTKRWRLIKIVK